MAVTEFSDFETAHRRRDLLQVLLASRDYSCNESLLRTVLRGQGYLPSAAQLRDDLFWLSERQLVRTREVGQPHLFDEQVVAQVVDVRGAWQARCGHWVLWMGAAVPVGGPDAALAGTTAVEGASVSGKVRRPVAASPVGR